MHLSKKYSVLIVFVLWLVVSAAKSADQTYQQQFEKALKAANESHYSEAESLWQALNKAYPNDLAVMNNLAVTLMRQGQFIEAQQVLEDALNSDAKIALVLKNLNGIYGYQAKLAYQNVFQESKVALPSGDWFSLHAIQLDKKEVKQVQQLSNEIQIVLNQLENWRSAWAGQNIASYLSFYQPNFRPDPSTSNASWVASRKRSLKRPKFIQIELSQVEALLLSDNQIQVTFWQSYRSNSFKDKVKKRLVWQKQAKEWKISEESVIHG